MKKKLLFASALAFAIPGFAHADWGPAQQVLGILLRRILVKKLLLIGTVILLTATSAQAQQFIGGSRYNYGNTHGGYVGSSIRLTPQDTACIRANYASTFALQRCADQMGTRVNTKRARR